MNPKLSQWIPDRIAQAVAGLDLTLSTQKVPEIQALVSSTLVLNGKKLRPVLCFLMADLTRCPFPQISPYARAAELVHAATLAHDDVIDAGGIRRHQPTLNARVGNARAVLIGDLLLARVMGELAQLGQLGMIQDLAAVVEELVQGEWLQLGARGDLNVSLSHLQEVARLKTASLISWSCVAPLRLQALSPTLIQAAREFGVSLGIAFQMLDDVIDFDPQSEKPFAQDLRDGLINFVTLELLQIRPDLRSQLSGMIGQIYDPDRTHWPWSADHLDQACRNVRRAACTRLDCARLLLDRLYAGLWDFPEDELLGKGSQERDAARTAFSAIGVLLIFLRSRFN